MTPGSTFDRGNRLEESLAEKAGGRRAAVGMVHHASRMALVTMLSRITGYLRDKTLSYVLGAGVMYDAFITATRIPSTFRMLLGEGALHAAFIPTLTQLRAEGKGGREARDLVRGVMAALLLIRRWWWRSGS